MIYGDLLSAIRQSLNLPMPSSIYSSFSLVSGRDAGLGIQCILEELGLDPYADIQTPRGRFMSAATVDNVMDCCVFLKGLGVEIEGAPWPLETTINQVRGVVEGLSNDALRIRMPDGVANSLPIDIVAIDHDGTVLASLFSGVIAMLPFEISSGDFKCDLSDPKCFKKFGQWLENRLAETISKHARLPSDFRSRSGIRERVTQGVRKLEL